MRSTSPSKFLSIAFQVRFVLDISFLVKSKIVLRGLFLLLVTCTSLSVAAQEFTIKGSVITSKGKALEFATVLVKDLGQGTQTDSLGKFILHIPAARRVQFAVSLLGYTSAQKWVDATQTIVNFVLEPMETGLDEVVVTGTMQEVTRSNSPVPVEVYRSSFFKSNPAPSLFESFQQINGVRPQINCSICNTGDIQINGLPGPYTMVLIDGMPLVSGLGTVYGLSGIPQALIDRIEVVKGPASTLYGSEAVAGLINIITKRPEAVPLISLDVFLSSWSETSVDLALKSSFGKRVQSLTGVNAFFYDRPIDNNGDGMTDLTLQKRISLFQKIDIQQKEGKSISLAGRFVAEDRWGGQMNWTTKDRGGDQVYGESIQTKRWEFFGSYALPVKEDLKLQVSANGHRQDSYYGTTFYGADQKIGFAQLTWKKTLGINQLLAGAAYRMTRYDDSTPATSQGESGATAPALTQLPGLFMQNELQLTTRQRILLGLRFDHSNQHGAIWSPRINYLLRNEEKSLIWRTSLGNGFRVANVFTEDHAALTGAREVVFMEELRPEQSWNMNSNLTKKIFTSKGNYFGLEGSLFYTHFINQILPDYESNPNQIRYANLNGRSISKGLSVNVDGLWANGFKALLGFTLMDVSFEDTGVWERQLFTERFSGVWTLGYHLHALELTLDYTGNVYSPMRLPLLGPLDDRPEYSPWWSVQNIQITKKLGASWELYGGVKNLLNYTPPSNSIARAFDPFDREVQFASDGSVLPSPNNPNALSFDPTYLFAPNQGIRGFLGIRFNW
jgi:outer membrane receptor for ferrienterochelin and colicins